jgi:DNA polymerase elongation subunit (family B)
MPALEVRLLDFHVDNPYRASRFRTGARRTKYVPGDTQLLSITAFGKTAEGETVALLVHDMKPTFYVKVCDQWDDDAAEAFHEFLQKNAGKRQAGEIETVELIDRGFLYGFDNSKQHKFLRIEFSSMPAMYGARRLWVDSNTRRISEFEWSPDDMPWTDSLRLCESTIPPLLRFFHEVGVPPAGWIALDTADCVAPPSRTTTCKREYVVRKQSITPLPQKSDMVPLCVASFDIEASSSHGDFPLAIKGYDKPANELVEAWEETGGAIPPGQEQAWLYNALARGYTGAPGSLSRMYTRKPVDPGALATAATAVGRMRVRPKVLDGDGDDDSASESSTSSATIRARSIFDALRDPKYPRTAQVGTVAAAMERHLPTLEGDRVTFVGTTFRNALTGEIQRTCICVGDCTDVPGCEAIICVETEAELLLEWAALMRQRDPDVVLSYNGFGFDYGFMADRANVRGVGREFLAVSRLADHCCGESKRGQPNTLAIADTTINIASGTHRLRYVAMPGRVNIDLYNHFRREVNLGSYKLDDVAGHFIGDKVGSLELTGDDRVTVKSKNLSGLEAGNFVTFSELGYTDEVLDDGQKYEVTAVRHREFDVVAAYPPASPSGLELRWGLAKDDIGPQDIFRLTETGDPGDKAVVAKYCVQDCDLLHHLFNKVDVLTGFTEMANICSVPLSFLVMRGQGIKLQSLLSRRCREKGIIMPDLDKTRGDEAYEGAEVIDPIIGIYHDDPTAIMDYSSLYPSCAISENISHDTKVWFEQKDLNGDIVETTRTTEYDDLEDHSFVEIGPFPTYVWRRKPGSTREVKTRTGTRTCCYAQLPGNQKGMIPLIEQELLAARKATRALITHKRVTLHDGTVFEGLLSKDGGGNHVVKGSGGAIAVAPEDVASVEEAYSDFMKNVFDKRQLGYKVAANSVYGQTGAKTSAFYEPDVAASITAKGRGLLHHARRMIEEKYGNTTCHVLGKDYQVNAVCRYGDTDSVFFSFGLCHMDGVRVKGREARAATIQLGKEAGAHVTKSLKKPHDLEYEKTFDPFILYSRKRYTGMQYGEDPDATPKKTSMGTVAKRRDNAAIVKDLYGLVEGSVLSGEGMATTVSALKVKLDELATGKVPVRKLVITKSLRSHYKNPAVIPHKMLARRMAARDPGNAPKPGSRIAFVHVCAGPKRQNMIESASYAVGQGLKLNYAHYITNQVMKPIQQTLALALESIPGFARKRNYYLGKLGALQELDLDEEAMARRTANIRASVVKMLVFDDALRKADNKALGQTDLRRWF